jgi:methylenetetrahydrofolate reductase (NADPH)
MNNQNLSQFQPSLFHPDHFTLTFELVPSRGGRSKKHARTLEMARRIARDGRIQAVSITENAGGHSALSPEVLGVEIRDMGLEVIIHFSCKDKNRNQMESILFAWDRLRLRNLLVITGDYPQPGYQGLPKPVFDLGSVHVLDLLGRMNQGRFNGDETTLQPEPIHPTSFFKGVALSPFKRLESELFMQYFKLHRKAAAGADYVITQIGFDARKFEEVLLYMRQWGLNLPVLGNVFVPNLTVTEYMYQGKVPGCVIPKKLYQEMQREASSPDKGKKARLRRAAKLLSILKGLGYAGAHIGGPGLVFEDLDFLLNVAEDIAPRWRSFIPELSYWFDDAFYLYRKDETTGLNNPSAETGSSHQGLPPFHYLFSRLVHDSAFQPTGPLYRPVKNLCLALDRLFQGKPLDRGEHLLKFLLFRCRNCGDCTLAELAYLCPQSGCAKYLFNGACGGSRDGWCEVYPGEKRCFFVRIYERLKRAGACESMMQGLIPPRNWELNGTSSWANYFRQKDHTSIIPDRSKL